MVNEAARAALESGRLGHLTTLNADGSPQTTVIWTGLDGDNLVIASLQDRAEIRASLQCLPSPGGRTPSSHALRLRPDTAARISV